MEKRSKPMWIQPTNDTKLPDVKLFNSFTNQKEIFKPHSGNHIEWYSCGPTVYDSSHMGHARAYISIDILRRVMQNYFQFDVHYVMNITDIDDKIIKRAKQNYLFEKYLTTLTESIDSKQQDIQDYIKRVLEHTNSKLNNETDPDKKIMLSTELEKIKHVLASATSEIINKDQLYNIKDSISDLLDREQGATVVDNSIFEALPRFYELDFMDDMRNLNVLPPDELTRVSEYIEPIISFVQRIIDNGYAYESNGSIYFDTERFDTSPHHYYAKLVPTAYGNENLLREGEGALTVFEAGDKRSENDFALWKSSKAGEPAWNSPWGLGRPGWHIECSAMAGDKCGAQLDIHTGGVDLKFPHHDNELAQSEAHYSCPQWVNYFLHTGHLTISGCKMSKSLKNFITIKQVLSTHSARQLRLMFLLHSWRDTLDYSSDTMMAAISYEKMILDFFYNVEHICRSQIKLDLANTAEIDGPLFQKLLSTKEKVNDALCDSIDTREVMAVLKDLVTAGNNHYTTLGVKNGNSAQLSEIAKYVCEILCMFGASDQCEPFGLIHYSNRDLANILTGSVAAAKQFVESIQAAMTDDNRDCISRLVTTFANQCTDLSSKSMIPLNLDLNSYNAIDSCSKTNLEDFLDLLALFRQEVRTVSIANKWRLFLKECDWLRDSSLAAIGVRLQDTDGPFSAVGLMPLWAQDKKAPAKTNVAPAKVTKSKIDASVHPRTMFTVGLHEGLYSLFDGEGLPTHDSAGVELSKNKRGKLKKLMAEQQKAHDKFLLA